MGSKGKACACVVGVLFHLASLIFGISLPRRGSKMLFERTPTSTDACRTLAINERVRYNALPITDPFCLTFVRV